MTTKIHRKMKKSFDRWQTNRPPEIGHQRRRVKKFTTEERTSRSLGWTSEEKKQQQREMNSIQQCHHIV